MAQKKRLHSQGEDKFIPRVFHMLKREKKDRTKH